MNNNTSVKIELNTTPQFQAKIEKITTGNPQLGFESVEDFMLEATRLYVQRFINVGGTDNPNTVIPVVLELPKEEIALVKKGAKDSKLTVDDYVIRLIREKTTSPGQVKTFEENSVAYERIPIDLPKAVVNLFRFKSIAQTGNMDLTEELISIDVIDKVKSEIDGVTPESFRAGFNLEEAFAEASRKEAQVFKD